MSHQAVKTRLCFPDHKPQFSSSPPPPFIFPGRCKNVSSVGLFPQSRVLLIRTSLVCVQTHACMCCFFMHSFIYLFPSTEPTVGPRCVARKQCPMATAEAHASTRTFLREKQDKPVQRKSGFNASRMSPCRYTVLITRSTCHRSTS